MFSFLKMDKEAREWSEKRAEEDLRIMIAHTLTSSAFVPLVYRNMKQRIKDGNGYFMDELMRFRTDVVGQVDGLTISDMTDMFVNKDSHITAITRPEWIDEFTWKLFEKNATSLLEFNAAATLYISQLVQMEGIAKQFEN